MSVENSEGFKLNSHEDKLLIDHLRNVSKNAKDLFLDLKINYNRVFNNSKDSIELDNIESILADVIYIIGASHDFAKATSYFQEKLAKKRDASEITRHSFASALFTYFIVKYYIDNCDYLKKFTPDDEISLFFNFIPVISYYVVKSHHTRLPNITKDMIKVNWIPKSFPKIIENLKSSNELSKIYNHLIKEPLSLNLQIDDIYLMIEEAMNETTFFFINLDVHEKIMDGFSESINKFSEKLCMFCYFLIKLFYSLLLEADKMDAAFNSEYPERPQDLDFLAYLENYRAEKGFTKHITEHEKILNSNKIDFLRTKIYETIKNNANKLATGKSDDNNKILVINVPTGMGKTLASLSTAFSLRKKNNYRIIYCLPYLSIIDQNYNVIQKIFKLDQSTANSLLLTHNHLSDMVYDQSKKRLNTDEDEYSALYAQLLIEGWNSEVVMTTFHQFFNTLFLNTNRQIRRFIKFINSVVILDEIQTIPLKYWPLIQKTILFLTDVFNMKFILVTATLPKIISNEKCKDLFPQKEDLFREINRIIYSFDIGKKTELNIFLNNVTNDLKNILETSKKQGSQVKILIVLNTRRCAKQTFNFIRSKLIDLLENVQLYYLSSEILPENRLNIIKKIKESTENIILVSTQVVEAGVDLDFNFVYRDFGPFDSIVQVAGRCNRNQKYSSTQSIMKIVYLVDEENNRKSFASYVYDPDLLLITNEIITNNNLENKIVHECNLYEIIQKFYSKIDEYFSKDKGKKLLTEISKLNFEYINDNFNLIEELSSFRFFLEINENAKNIWEEYRKTKQLTSGLLRKNKLLNLRSKLNKYSINIHLNHREINLLQEKMNKEGLHFNFDDWNYIPYEKIPLFYNETGLIIDNQNI